MEPRGQLPEIKERKQPEKKELEKKFKISEMQLAQEEGQPKPLSKMDFLQQVYRNKKPLYCADIKLDDEASEKELTEQVRALIQQIKIEFYKTAILQRVADNKELTPEQISYIYLDLDILEKSTDPIQQAFAKFLKQIPKDDWDKMVDYYFTSFSDKTFFGDTKASPLRAAERSELFTKGKKYLETILYKIRTLDLSAALIKQALNVLYEKIGVCPGGILNDLQEANSYLAENLETIIARQLDKLCSLKLRKV